MSAAKGVPLTRELLEALLGLSGALLRHGDDGVALDASKLGRACLAALASDAGTPEGEPFFHRIGCPKISGRGTAAHCTCPREMRAMTDEEMSASQTAAPLDESGAAAPDAELDGLILAHASTVHQHPQDSFALGKTHQAIRAHVARVTQEAREAGREAAAREFANDQGLVWREKEDV